jgi:hypothetical protein
LRIFLDNSSVTFSTGKIVSPETSVRNYHNSLRNKAEECSSCLLRSGSLKSNNIATAFKDDLHDFYFITNHFWDTLLVAQLVEALRYKPEGRGFDFRWCH